MDRNRVILGVLIAMVLLSAVKIPAIPVETEASTAYEIESHDEEFDGSEMRVDASTAETSSSWRLEDNESDTDDGSANQPGGGVSAMRRPTEYEVPLEHEIASVEVAGSTDDGELVVEVAVRNVDDRAGEFGATVEYERDGTVVQAGQTDTRMIAPNETATVEHRVDYTGDADRYTVNVSIDAETKTVSSTAEPDTSTQNAAVPLHEVPMDHGVESVEVSESPDSSDLVVEVELRNADETVGEFGADVAYVRDVTVVERDATDRRPIQPGETVTVRDRFNYTGDADEYTVDVSADPETKVIGKTSEPDTATVNASVPIRSVGLTHEIVEVNTSVDGDDLVSRVVLRNDDRVRGEFTVEFTYRNETGTRTVVREPVIAAGETRTVTSTVPFEEYEVSVAVTPGTKAVGAPGDVEIDATTQTVTRTTTVTRERRVTVLEYIQRLFG